MLRECSLASRIAHGERLQTSDYTLASHCLGYIEAAATGMIQRHKLYEYVFPGLRKSDLNSRPVFEKFMSAAFDAGADVCIPPKTPIQTLVQIIINYLDKNPENLSNSPFLAANGAWQEVFPCNLPP